MMRRSTLLSLAFMLAAISLPLQPLLVGQTPWQGDGLLHLYRLAALEQSFSFTTLAGWFPRWVPVLGYGYGFPLFNYYAPLSYYLVLPLRWLGVSLPAATAVSYALAGLLLGGSVFGWGRAMWGERAGRVAALLVILAPYMLINLYQRAALAELWGLAWLAAALWAAWATANGRQGGWTALVLSFSALLLTHNITALIGLPLVLAVGVWSRETGELGGRGNLGRLLAALGLALLLGAFFWLPALLEQDYVQIERLVSTANFAYENHFLSWVDLLAVPPAADPALVNPPLPYALGWPQLALALLGVWGLLRRKLSDAGGWSAVGLLLGTAVCLLMTLPAADFLWANLPLIRFVQFPWRFLGPAAIGLALLGGYGAAAVLNGWPIAEKRGALVVGLIWLAAAGFGLPYLFPPNAPTLPTDPTPADLVDFERESGWLGTTSAADYLPVAVNALPEPLTAAEPSFLVGGPAIIVKQETAGAYSFNQFYFPGWEARVDGKTAAVYPSGPHGLLTVDLPVGTHEISFSFEQTPLRWWATAASLAGWLGFALWGLIILRRRPAAQTERDRSGAGPAFTLRGSALFFLLAVGLILGKSLLLDRLDSPVRQTRYDGRTMTGVGQMLQVDFAGRLALIGADLPAEPVAADRPLTLSLYWRGLTFDREVSVSVHLLTADGQRVGQSDHLHPADFPLPRWRPEQYARDVHEIIPIVGIPPGNYRLQLFVTDTTAADGRRLEIINEAGQPLGVDLELGLVAIGLPNRFPEPADIAPRERLDLPLALGVELLGVDGPAAPVMVGEVIPLTLYWYTPERPAAAFAQPLGLVSGGVTRLSVPLSAAAPDSGWAPGRLQRDDYLLRLPAGLPEGGYALQIGEEMITQFDITIPIRSFDRPEVDITIEEPVGEIARLAGVSLTPCPAAPTLPCTVSLLWEALAETAAGYTVFVQLLGPDGRVAAQHDAPPTNKTEPRPTSGWLAGEFLLDQHSLPLPVDLLAGEYSLIAGLYDPTSGERLPAAAGDHVLIGRFQVD